MFYWLLLSIKPMVYTLFPEQATESSEIVTDYVQVRSWFKCTNIIFWRESCRRFLDFSKAFDPVSHIIIVVKVMK